MLHSSLEKKNNRCLLGCTVHSLQESINNLVACKRPRLEADTQKEWVQREGGTTVYARDVCSRRP